MRTVVQRICPETSYMDYLLWQVEKEDEDEEAACDCESRCMYMGACDGKEMCACMMCRCETGILPKHKIMPLKSERRDADSLETN